MTPLDRLLIEQACRDLVQQAAARTDAQDHAGFAALFTPGAVLVRPNGQSLLGREAIEASYRARPADRITRHLLCGTVFGACEADAAQATTQVLLWSGDAESELGPFGRRSPQQVLGAFEDRLEHTPEGWRIAHRVASFTLYCD
jgi:ketosteroid isomerase-like protein